MCNFNEAVRKASNIRINSNTSLVRSERMEHQLLVNIESHIICCEPVIRGVGVWAQMQ